MSGTIARMTGSLHVHVFGLLICAINFSRDQSSNKLINFLDSRLDPRSSIHETRDSKLSRIEYRGSRLEARGSRDFQLTFELYCSHHKQPSLTIDRSIGRFCIECAFFQNRCLFPLPVCTYVTKVAIYFALKYFFTDAKTLQ